VTIAVSLIRLIATAEQIYNNRGRAPNFCISPN